jgi:hypothetical protein
MGQGADTLEHLEIDEAWDDERNAYEREQREQRAPAKYTHGFVKKATRGEKAMMECHCGEVYLAREADLARGWAKSCSKRCASIRRDFGRPAAKRANQPAKQVQP